MATSNASLSPGTLLLAAPMMQDPNFHRSVILLCEHGENGTFGLILNRPLDVKLGDVMEEFFAHDPHVHLGGPVQRNTLHYVHRRPSDVPEGVTLNGGVIWGGDFESIKTIVRSGKMEHDDVRFFLGYAGWSPGQLREEVNEGAWITSSILPDLVFDSGVEGLWREALRRMGGDYALLSTFPDDPRMN